jgi:hypothetical protein
MMRAFRRGTQKMKMALPTNCFARVYVFERFAEVPHAGMIQGVGINGCGPMIDGEQISMAVEIGTRLQYARAGATGAAK